MSKKIAILLAVVTLTSVSASAFPHTDDDNINSVPTPDAGSTMMLLAPALVGLAFLARKNK